MKRVLVLNGDSYVGQEVVRAFYNSREYAVEITLSHRDDDLMTRSREPLAGSQGLPGSVPQQLSAPRPDSATQALSVEATLQYLEESAGTGVPQPSDLLPLSLLPYVSAVVPRHNSAPDEFCRRVLANDIIIGVLEDDHYEAECAIKVLLGSHYEVEKTFVLVSSCITWAHTLTAERHIARMTRRAEREAELAAFLEDAEEDEEIPEELREPEEEEEDDVLVPPRTFHEEDYVQRVAHPRYQHWKELEHMTKRANSETLHTYVLFSGLPYGSGEGPLYGLMRAAWHHQTLPLYGSGNNVVPMIHVQDLANIVYNVGSSYDTLEDRYMFAVDRGNITQKEFLQAISRCVGGTIQSVREDPATSVDMTNIAESKLPRPVTMEELQSLYMNDPSAGPYLPFFLSDIAAEPSAVFGVYDEESWVGLDGFAEAIDKVFYQFREVRQLQPHRVMVTGPPFSGAETLGAAIAGHYGVPYLTAENVTAAYEAHTAAVREELHNLLAGRLQRRRDRVHVVHCQSIAEEKAQLREAKLERSAARRRREEEEDEEDGDDEGQQRLDGEDSQNDDEEDEEESEEEEGPESEDGGDVISELSVAEDPPHRVSAYDMITERYLIGLSMQDGEEFEEDEEVDEDAEENLFADEDDDESGLTRAHLRARTAIRAKDLAELIRIQELRLEYRLALKVLSMKTINGTLPKPANPDEEEEESEEDEENPRHQKLRDGSDGGSNQESGEEEEGEEDGVADEDEESDLEEESETSGGGQEDLHPQKMKKVEVDHSNDVHTYLDEALTFFARWRLRQPDCRNQGYVLQGFPRTVRQACLLFSADTPEEEELRPRRVLPPSTVEEVLPPADAEFPFPSIMDLEDEARTALEVQIREDRLPIVDINEEGVLAEVDESTFPDVVVILNEKDEVLQMIASSLCTYYPPETPAAIVDGGLLCNVNDSPAAAPKVKCAGGADAGASVTMTSVSPLVEQGCPIITRPLSGAATVPEPCTTHVPSDPHQQFKQAVLAAASDEGSFYLQLDYFRKHHSEKGPPVNSVTTWLQSVMTNEVRGATTPPLLLHSPAVLTGGDGVDDAAAGDNEETEMQPPALTRATQVLLCNSPPRDAACVLRELDDVLPILLGATNHLPDPTLTDFGKHTTSHPSMRMYEMQPPKHLDEKLQPLQWLARNLLSTKSLPSRTLFGPPPKDDLVERLVRKELVKEQRCFEALQEFERNQCEEMKHKDEEEVLDERRRLRYLQLREECIGAWNAAQLPMESYLMKYVLPSLTPALAEIVRMRPEDPVTALADLLFSYHRRTDLS